jgi:hypothetical protein
VSSAADADFVTVTVGMSAASGTGVVQADSRPADTTSSRVVSRFMCGSTSGSTLPLRRFRGAAQTINRGCTDRRLEPG